MAWHSVTQAQELTGKSRRTLYRDMASGRVTYRTNSKGHREFETTELIRVYGELEQSGTAEWPTVAQSSGTQNDGVVLAEIRALRQEVDDLKALLMRLEHKTTESPAESTTRPWWRFWSRKE